MTERKRELIRRKLAESRQLGKDADADGRKAVDGLRRAARSGRYRGSTRVRRRSPV